MFYGLFMVDMAELFPRETNYDWEKLGLKNCMRAWVDVFIVRTFVLRRADRRAKYRSRR